MRDPRQDGQPKHEADALEPSRAQPIAPARALLSPPWLLALALLLANDHWLKGAGLIPELLTGKLSDFAGMIVAPVLLAVVLGVRTRRALAGCHVAVGLVFAGIQLSPGFAALWTAATGLLGYPWAITCDPSDLLALPCLGLSWALLVPHMDPERSPLSPLRRSAVAGLCVLGLWSSLATTEGPEFEPVYEPVFGSLYINNTNDQDLALFIRNLREDLEVDCEAVATDPGRLLSSAAFDEAEHWLLPPRTNVSLQFRRQPCDAVWIAGEGIAPTIIFIDDLQAYPSQSWPGSTDSSAELDEIGLGLHFEGEGTATWIGGEDIRFTPRDDAPAQPDSCESLGGSERIDWSEITTEPTQILAVEGGPDGCFELLLQDLFTIADQVLPDGDPHPWYLCAPAAAVPFVVDEVIELRETTGGGARELEITLLDPDTLDPATDAEGVLVRRVRALHGGNDPAFIGPAFGRELEGVPASACAFVLEPGCAMAERHGQLQVTGSQEPLPIGAPVAFADAPGSGAKLRTVVLARVRERAIVDPLCSSGAQLLEWDIDVALIEEPLI
jgi:hypothetical protein